MSFGWRDHTAMAIISDIRPDGQIWGWMAPRNQRNNAQRELEVLKELYQKYLVDPTLNRPKFLTNANTLRYVWTGGPAEDALGIKPPAPAKPPINAQPGQPPKYNPILTNSETLNAAIRESKILSFTYTRATGKPGQIGQMSHRVVEPIYCFMSKNQQAILLAVDKYRSNQFRAFRLANITNEKVGESFKFDPEKQLDRVTKTLDKLKKNPETEDGSLAEGLTRYHNQLLKSVNKKKKDSKKEEKKKE